MKHTFVVFILSFILISCNSEDESKNETESCTDYPEWSSSPYVLPFPVGENFRISQGNCTAIPSFTHQGTLKFSYDIEMPFGSAVTAARNGTVFMVRDTQPAGSRGLTASNYIQVMHDDGVVSEYVHLAQNSSRVSIGERVNIGDTLAFTGDTGDVGMYEHLHFDINPCANNLRCETLPVTFRNTRPNPDGLLLDEFYEALPF